ncbi:hypothetical protein AMTRI_Chr01g128930 [Amborella trichopoda]
MANKTNVSYSESSHITYSESSLQLGSATPESSKLEPSIPTLSLRNESRMVPTINASIGERASCPPCKGITSVNKPEKRLIVFDQSREGTIRIVGLTPNLNMENRFGKEEIFDGSQLGLNEGILAVALASLERIRRERERGATLMDMMNPIYSPPEEGSCNVWNNKMLEERQDQEREDQEREDIDTLLSSDDEDEVTSDDEEDENEVTTGHSLVKNLGNDEEEQELSTGHWPIENLGKNEEVVDSCGPRKKRRTEGSHGFSDSESKSRKNRIKKMLMTLRGLVPGGSDRDTNGVLEEAVQYMKTLQLKVYPTVKDRNK